MSQLEMEKKEFQKFLSMYVLFRRVEESKKISPFFATEVYIYMENFLTGWIALTAAFQRILGTLERAGVISFFTKDKDVAELITILRQEDEQSITDKYYKKKESFRAKLQETLNQQVIKIDPILYEHKSTTFRPEEFGYKCLKNDWDYAVNKLVSPEFAANIDKIFNSCDDGHIGIPQAFVALKKEFSAQYAGYDQLPAQLADFMGSLGLTNKILSAAVEDNVSCETTEKQQDNTEEDLAKSICDGAVKAAIEGSNPIERLEGYLKQETEKGKIKTDFYQRAIMMYLNLHKALCDIACVLDSPLPKETRTLLFEQMAQYSIKEDFTIPNMDTLKKSLATIMEQYYHTYGAKKDSRIYNFMSTLGCFDDRPEIDERYNKALVLSGWMSQKLQTELNKEQGE